MVVSWVVAIAVLVGLATAVVHYLAAGGPSGSSAMAMHMSSALYRGGRGADSQLHQPLFGTAFFTAWQLDAVALAVLIVLAAGYLTAASLVPIRGDGTALAGHPDRVVPGRSAGVRIRHQRQHRGV